MPSSNLFKINISWRKLQWHKRTWSSLLILYMFDPFLSYLLQSAPVSYLSPHIQLIITAHHVLQEERFISVHYCILLTSRNLLLFWSKLVFQCCFIDEAQANFQRDVKTHLSIFQILSMRKKQTQFKREGFFFCFGVFKKHDRSNFPCSSLAKSGIGETVHKNSSETPTKHEKFHHDLPKPDSYK